MPSRFELIANAPDGQEAARDARVEFNFFAQAADVDGDGTWVNIIGQPPDIFKELVAGEDLARVAGEQHEQIEFFGGQVFFLVLDQDEPLLRINAAKKPAVS